MCSRYELNETYNQILARFDISGNAKSNTNFVSIQEVRPTDHAPVVINNEIRMLRWGLSNDWSSNSIINARSETIDIKPTFQHLTANRCLVPASAYFEWKKIGRKRIKTRIQYKHKEIMAFAGLFRADQFTILTCHSIKLISHVHNRMPVILTKKNESKWLSGKTTLSSSSIKKFMVSDQEQDFSITEVNPAKSEFPAQHEMFD